MEFDNTETIKQAIAVGAGVSILPRPTIMKEVGNRTLAAIPLTTDLYGVARDISAVTFTPVPLLIVASIWYLFFTSILMVGQYFLEKRFSRGVGARRPDKADGLAVTGATPVIDGNDVGGKG